MGIDVAKADGGHGDDPKINCVKNPLDAAVKVECDVGAKADVDGIERDVDDAEGYQQVDKKGAEFSQV